LNISALLDSLNGGPLLFKITSIANVLEALHLLDQSW
jgi:hypothetical protein